MASEDVQAPAVVCNVKVLSDKVKDISSLEMWKRSYLKEGMSDKDKGLACWETVVTYQHQETPPNEFLQQEPNVLDPIKLFNVYGYSLCSVAAGEVAALAREAGLKSRGWTINAHCVPEVQWDNSWHMLDSSLINYFPKPDGQIASVREISDAVQGWLKDHPDLKGDDAKLRVYGWAEQKTAWKKLGPDLLSRNPFYNERGWWPAGTHGWYSTMQEYDGSGKTPFDWISLPALGYQVNIQLREGERLTRNWSNKGLHINMDGSGGKPGCMNMVTGKDALQYTPKYGDIAPGRVGNGTLEYNVPMTSALQASAARFENVLITEASSPGGQSLTVKDANKPGILEIRMPSSYVYLTGKLRFIPRMEAGSAIAVSFSDNNGLDWKKLSTVQNGESSEADLSKLVLRRYDYRLRFELNGKGAGLRSLEVFHDIQHSQRPLPALDKGQNTITLTAGAQEGTITVEGSTSAEARGKQLLLTDFHPLIEGFNETYVAKDKATIAFPVQTPGEMTRLRIGCAYRTWTEVDGINVEVSFDGGKTFKALEPFGKSDTYTTRYLVYKDIPVGTKSAMVRYVATSNGTLQLANFHINADYKQPNAGFRPVKVTYIWDESGVEKKDEHVAMTAEDTWKITCTEKPVMKSIAMELAK